MPRRKRSTIQNERRRKVLRRDDKDDNDDEEEEEEAEEEDTQVISDSESDEEEEGCGIKATPRAARRLERAKRAHVQDMTEDEMLDLALRLSKQEATCATQREEVEENDLRKAIAESLQVSHSQASEMSSMRARSAAKPHQDQDTVTAKARCKLSFPIKVENDGGGDGVYPETGMSALKSVEEVNPLPPMPDLSQRTLSQPSPPSPTLSSVPSAASQESHSSSLAKQEFDAGFPEDEPSQSDCPLEGSSVFLRQCSVRLNRKQLSTSSSSRNIPSTNSSSLSLSSPVKSQNSPPPPISPVFPKSDSKRCTKLNKTQDKFSNCTSRSSFADSTCKSEDPIQESSSPKSRDSPKSLPQSRKAQPSLPISVPEDHKQEAVKLQQVKDESSRGAGLCTMSDRAPNSNISLPGDCKHLNEFTSHMVLHLSDEDDDDEDEDNENEKMIPPSPVFPQDRTSCAGQPELSPTQLCCLPPTAITRQDSFQTPSQAESEQTKVPRKSADSRLRPPVEGLVSYYWGVPFCPKGQSPDDYTRVILTQLEVYEKSLKEAQRQLLHKADWGVPVFPCPVERPHGRRLKRHRAPQLLEEEEEEEEEDKGRDEEEREKKKAQRKEREDSQPCSEEGAENAQHETYVVVSSPEPQEELRQKSPLLFRRQESPNSAKPSSCRKPLCQELSEDTQVQPEPDEHGEEVQNGSDVDVESTVCPETQITEDNTPELMVTSPAQPLFQVETDVMEVDEVKEPAAETEERMEQDRPGEEQSWRDPVPSQVECPICTRLFPLSKIEVHAAYCNGTVEDQSQSQDQDQDQQDLLLQGSTRRKSVRRPAMEDNVRFEKSEPREKCFLCNKFFTSKEYSHHVDQCLQQKTLGPKQGNGLLSALNRTETMPLDDSGAGPSNASTRNQNRGPADVPVMPGDSMDSQSLGYYVSTSPIKSFTPISEITDCLINFRQQYSDRTTHRLGRKRKFKR